MAYENVIKTAQGTLTNAQIKALHGTPIAAIAAPGSGNAIQVISAAAKMVYGGTNAFTAGAAQTIQLYWNATTAANIIMLTNANIVATATQLNLGFTSAAATGANTLFDNLALQLYNPIATEITGNAGSDNTVTWSIVYQLVKI